MAEPQDHTPVSWGSFDRVMKDVLSRLTALESRPCNCSAASSAGSSAHGGASPSAPSSSSSGAAGATGSSDPVSAAIRDSTVYGFCPHCGAAGSNRERRPNGYDICVNGHRYPSSTAVYSPKPEAKADRESAMRAAVDREPVWTKQAGETAWERFIHAAYGRPVESVGKAARYVGPEEFNRFIAAEVAAAKREWGRAQYGPIPKHQDVEQFYKDEPPKPHAETAEEVAEAVYRDPHFIQHLSGKGILGWMVAAIKRERGEA